jgi:hypothetical protein
MDTKTKNYFGKLEEPPMHLPEQTLQRNLLARAVKFIPVQDIQNHHFQLHHSFKAISPNTFIYPTTTHVEMLNVPNLKKTVLLNSSEITCVTSSGVLMACAHRGRKIDIVNMEEPGVVVKSFNLDMEQEQINHI